MPVANENFRRGKWTKEEERYAKQLISDFESGLLPIDEGTSLRTLLSHLLKCDPMRITKKFTGLQAIGKREYCPLRSSPENDLLIKAAQANLMLLRDEWLVKKTYSSRMKRKAESSDSDSDSTTSSDVAPTSSSFHKKMRTAHANVPSEADLMRLNWVSSESYQRMVNQRALAPNDIIAGIHHGKGLEYGFPYGNGLIPVGSFHPAYSNDTNGDTTPDRASTSSAETVTGMIPEDVTPLNEFGDIEAIDALLALGSHC